MCGIVGIAGKLSIKHERTFNDLLIMNQLRGFDSVGIAKVGYSRVPEVAKSLDNPVDFITSPEYTKVLRGCNRVLIGHNRAATAGKVVVENAHPFEHGHITGVHNGTLTYRRDLEGWQDFVVDSDNIYYHMAQKGVRDLWTKIWGAAALVWWDSKTETVNMLRNKERPLFLAYEKGGDVVVWASEFHMLMAACYRNGVVLDKSPFSTTVDKLYSFHIPAGHNNKIVAKEEEIPSFIPVQRSYIYELPLRDGIDKRPTWLRTGEEVDCMFEEEFTINNLRRFEGFSPLDDRVNFSIHYLNTGQNPPIQLDKKLKIYRGTIDLITTVYRKGVLEWDVKLKNVYAAVNKDGSDKNIEDIEIALDDALLDDFPPFDEGDVDCKTLCTFKSEVICSKCRLAFKGNEGTWTTKRGQEKHCCWCATKLGDSEVAYVTKDKEDVYCQDCFKVVVKWLANRNLKGYN